MKWALLALMAMLPLQWFVIPGVPLGQGRVHLVAMALFLACALARYRGRAFRPVLRVCLPFALAELVLLTVWVATGFYHGASPLEPAQDLLYLGVMLTVGTVIFRLAQGRAEDLAPLRWSALTASLSLLLAMSVSMAVNGVNPVSVFTGTIAAGDPEILQRELFRSAFVGFGLDEATVSGNVRHEIFAALLGSLYLSSWAARLHPLPRGWQRTLYIGSVSIAVGVLLVSMSRAVLLAALVWPLLALWRLVVSGRLTSAHVALAVTTAAGLLVAAASGFAAVIWYRFTEDTSSYEARNGLLDLALENISNSPFTGGADTEGASAHNIVLDAWQRSGILAAAAALVMTVLLVGLFAALVIRLGDQPSWAVPIAAALALPLVRIFTAGGGLITPVSWVVLGFVAGAVALGTTARTHTRHLRESNDMERAHTHAGSSG